jgi:hypothetical protein
MFNDNLSMKRLAYVLNCEQMAFAFFIEVTVQIVSFPYQPLQS